MARTTPRYPRRMGEARWESIARGLLVASIAALPFGWFPPLPWIGANAQWSDVLAAVAAVSWVAALIARRRLPRVRLFEITVIGYVAIVAMRPWTWKTLGVVELGALAIMTSDLLDDAESARTLALAVACSTIVVVAAGFVGLVWFYAAGSNPFLGIYGDLLTSPRYARVRAFQQIPNQLATYLTFAVAIMARDAAPPRTLVRVASVGAAALIPFTFSRALLSFGVAAVARRFLPSRPLLVAGSAAACAAVLVCLTLFNLQLDPTRPLEAHLSHDLTVRASASSTAWVTALENPLRGCGTDCRPGMTWKGPMDAHLTPLHLAATLGFPAAIAFLAVLAAAWFGRRRPMEIAVWSGLLALGLEALCTDIEDFRHLWILLGLAVGGVRRSGPRP